MNDNDLAEKLLMNRKYLNECIVDAYGGLETNKRIECIEILQDKLKRFKKENEENERKILELAVKTEDSRVIEKLINWKCTKVCYECSHVEFVEEIEGFKCKKFNLEFDDAPLDSCTCDYYK